jgi:hypothetical protein
MKLGELWRANNLYNGHRHFVFGKEKQSLRCRRECEQCCRRK